MSFVLKSTEERARLWKPMFASELPELAFHVWPETGDPQKVRYLAAWQPPENLAENFSNLEVLFSVGAGVDQLNLASIPENVRVVRMMEPGLAEGMIEYVLWAVLSYHRNMFQYARQQEAHVWKGTPNVSSSLFRVGVMGMGALGTPVLKKLSQFGYVCHGWSRSRHDIPGIKSYAGPEELDAFLAATDVLVCLMPLTEATKGILNKELFAKLRKGACLINCGRGGHLAQDDLLLALDEGLLSQAVLDVTDPEPLPEDHPFWNHPLITLTPHIASSSHAETGGEMILKNILQFEKGAEMVGEINRSSGY
ncbi:MULTISPECIES: glyoxylate/hydroxypyruvate reductase A [Gluconobacter]|uniref:2-hydroxyacid dehydrogenase n=1 Tax=Gluconobacter TaxID=441 RepID=UPI000A39BDD0|nr:MULTISPECIES: glyoxylate/hydroxypyruvate reductase A [Gluconobacter]MBS1038749.1 glyoxylate/hydroxypyruvate reductase A [Gluconobacter cerinus]OUJ06407.1 2-hydroxyacid dehydrogenase [Gluconobacter sp. DsW_058]